MRDSSVGIKALDNEQTSSGNESWEPVEVLCWYISLFCSEWRRKKHSWFNHICSKVDTKGERANDLPLLQRQSFADIHHVSTNLSCIFHEGIIHFLLPINLEVLKHLTHYQLTHTKLKLKQWNLFHVICFFTMPCVHPWGTALQVSDMWKCLVLYSIFMVSIEDKHYILHSWSVLVCDLFSKLNMFR